MEIVDKTSALQDQEMLVLEQSIMDMLELTGEMLIFLEQLEAYALKVEVLEQQGLYVEIPVVFRQAVNRVAGGIVRVFNSRVIEIKVLRQQVEAPELAAHAVVDNLDLMSEARHQVIHRSHRPERILPQAHRHQETMAAAIVKAVVRADQDVDDNKI